MCVPDETAVGVEDDVESLLAATGSTCRRAHVVCCGAPSLYAGDLRNFERNATETLRQLEPLAGDHDIVVTHPTCAVVIRDEYPRRIGTDDAAEVARRVISPARAVLDRGDPTDQAPRSDVTVTLHVSGHAQLLDPDLPAVRLLDREGFDVTVVCETDGTESIGHLGARFDVASDRLAQRWCARVAEISSPTTEIIASDGAVVGRPPARGDDLRLRHPIRIVADACRARRSS